MHLIGIACRTSNNNGENARDIPALWERFSKEDIFNKIPNRASNEVIALYCDYEGDHTKPYSCVIGCVVNTTDKIPEGMVAKSVPAATFASFKATGEFPKSLMETWGKIWGDQALRRTYVGDYEVYSEEFAAGKTQDVDVLVAIED